MDESRFKVLIVDDEPIINQLLESELEEKNYICVTASNGNEALHKLIMHEFDLVLLDIKLPDMSGIYLLREIIANYPGIPVIMVTGVIDIDTAVVAIKMGASDYIVKPFDLNKLTTCVARTIFSRKSQDTDNVLRRKTYIEDTKSIYEDPVINELDSISHGVEQRIDHITGSSKIITERTIKIARRLKMPDEKIRQWKTRKMELDLDKKNLFNNLINKDEQNSVDYAIMNAINLLVDKD